MSCSLRPTPGLILWVALSALGGCFDVHVNSGEVACGPGDLCPDGLACISGSCQLPGTAPDPRDAGPRADGSPRGGDGGMADGGMLDASTSSLGPFSSEAPIGGVAGSGYTLYAPSITDDGLELYMQARNDAAPNYTFIVWSVREQTSDPWPAPTDTSVASGDSFGRDPLILPDGLTMYLSAYDGTSFDVYRVTRASRAAAWTTGSATKVSSPISQTTSNDYGPCVTPDETTMIFPSDRGGTFHLWRSTRPDTGSSWGTPVELTGIEGADGDEQDCWVAPDESELFFGSIRSGGGGIVNIWHADGDGNGSYSNATEVSELSKAGTATFHPFLTSDRRTILFGRDGALYSATR